MTGTEKWQKLAIALRELHRTLMECARRDYEREHEVVLSPLEQLRLLTSDEYFDWLHRLSELIVDIDVVCDAEPPELAEIVPAVRSAVEHFIGAAPVPPESGDAFAQHYWSYLQNDPDVVIAHRDVKRALEFWPRSQKTDAANTPMISPICIRHGVPPRM